MQSIAHYFSVNATTIPEHETQRLCRLQYLNTNRTVCLDLGIFSSIILSSVIGKQRVPYSKRFLDTVMRKCKG